jgi:hypothetical protein
LSRELALVTRGSGSMGTKSSVGILQAGRQYIYIDANFALMTSEPVMRPQGEGFEIKVSTEYIQGDQVPVRFIF